MWITRALGWHVGYGETKVRYGFTDAAPLVNQTIDAGIDDGSARAFSRRTTLTCSTSTSALRFDGQTHYLLNCAATLSKTASRVGSAKARNISTASCMKRTYKQSLMDCK